MGVELIRILGLDVQYLVSQRKNALESYEGYTREELIKELKYVKEKHDGKYEPYCFVLEQYLKSLIDNDDGDSQKEALSEEKETTAV